jgi:hypothetical protein
MGMGERPGGRICKGLHRRTPAAVPRSVVTAGQMLSASLPDDHNTTSRSSNKVKLQGRRQGPGVGCEYRIKDP